MSSESGDSVFCEDPSTQFHDRGGYAAFGNAQDQGKEGVSDDSMNQVPGRAKQHNNEVRLIVEGGSSTFGNTVFYEDPMTQSYGVGRSTVVASQDLRHQGAQDDSMDQHQAQPHCPDVWAGPVAPHQWN